MRKSISIFSVILLSFVILLSSGLIVRSIEKYEVKYEESNGIEPLKFIGEYSVDGRDFRTLTSKTDIDIKKGQTIVLAGKFDRDIINEEILFTFKNFKFSMKVNGDYVSEYGQPGTYPEFLKSTGFARYMYSADYITAEDFIEIELTYPYNRGGRTAFYEFINKITTGKKENYYSMYVTNYGFHFLMVTNIILIGVCLFAASTLLRLWKNKNGLRMLSFSVFVIAGGVWFLMDTFYTSANVIIPYATTMNIVDMVNLLLLPLSGVFFLTSFFENSTTQKIGATVKLGQLICILTIIALQFFGVKDIYENQIVSIPVNSAACFIVIVTAFFEAVIDNNKHIKSALIAIIPTAIVVYTDITIHFSNPRKYMYLFRRGFIMSCCIHLIISIKLFKQSVEVKNREQQLKDQLMNLKVSVMLSQIQPHFLYNALNAIQYICMEDANKAAEAIEHFGKYLRGNMDSLKQKELIPFKKELNHLGNYLYIEHLRFGDRVKVKYDLNVTDFLVPCLIIQPIVENSIRYGITRRVEGGTVNIVTMENDMDIIIKISDDGIGFNPDKIQYDNRSHIGIENVRERLKLQCNGTLNVESVLNVGTTITIQIPKEGVLIL